MPVVLLISYSGVLGGAERALLDFGSGLNAELWLACPEGELASAARAAGVRVRELSRRPLEFRGSAGRRAQALRHLAAHGISARAAVRDLDPDLVVACGMRSGLGLLLIDAVQIPVIFLHNDMLPGPLIARAVRRAARRADLTIVPSRAVAADLALSPGPVVIHPGVDVDAFAGGRGPDGPPEVLMLGALVPWKRPHLALEAVAIARATMPEIRLSLMGAPLDDGGRFVSFLRRRAQQADLAGSVRFEGYVPDPRPALRRAACLLHCADREPFGLAVAEAMAAGCPVVVPASGGPAEIVVDDSGLRFAPGDARACASALLEVLGDRERARDMGERGRSRVREQFERSAARARFAAVAAPWLGPPATAEAGAASLALLTVTHNSAPELSALLRSAERHLPGARVVVVDCASSDDSVEVAAACPMAVSLPLPENVGFGRACNRGLELIDEPVSVLINPDAELLDDSLAALADDALRSPERLLAPLVLSPDGSRQDTVHPRPASLPDVMRAVLPSRLVLGATPWRARRARPVGWAVGCALAARTETLRALGPFDPEIFMYGEDLDLGLRAGQAGIATWFCPRARVLHHAAHSTATALGGERFRLLARNRHEVVARRLGRRSAAVDDAAQAVTFISRILAKRVMGRDARRERQALRALLALRHGR